MGTQWDISSTFYPSRNLAHSKQTESYRGNPLKRAPPPAVGRVQKGTSYQHGKRHADGAGYVD